MAKKRPRRPVSPQRTVAIVSAIIVLASLLIAIGMKITVPKTLSASQSVTLEHGEMTTLHATITDERNPGLVEMWRDGKGDAYVSVPETWILRDVQGASLTDVKADPVKNAFRRRPIPANAHVSFLVPRTEHIVV